MKVCMYPAGNENRASSRYRVYNVIEAHSAFIMGKKDNWRSANALVFQRNTRHMRLAREAKEIGKLIVFDCTDFYWHHHIWKHLWPRVKGMCELAHVLTTSNQDDAHDMRALFKKPVYVIPCAQKPSKYHRKHRRVEVPTIVWVGRENRMEKTLKELWPILHRLRLFGTPFRMVLINDTGSTRGLTLPFTEIIGKKWQLNTVYQEIAKCDVGICPQERQADGRFHKDENKAYTYWLCGVPCVSFARTNDWFGDLQKLLIDYRFRQQQGPRGIRRAKEVHPKNVARGWHGVITKELNRQK